MPQIAIIIDDVGYRLRSDRRALALPGPITYAILPDAPYSRSFAELAYASNKELLLHVPMESIGGAALGPGAITAEMSPAEVEAILDHNVQSVPHISGISNHMGSLLSAREDRMRWLVQIVREKHEKLFFVDSRTTPHSVLTRAAREAGVPVIARDVFLDHSLDGAAITRQFERLVAHAKATGTALAIGHPHPETLGVLHAELENLDLYGVQLVAVSKLLERRFAADGQARYRVRQPPAHSTGIGIREAPVVGEAAAVPLPLARPGGGFPSLASGLAVTRRPGNPDQVQPDHPE